MGSEGHHIFLTGFMGTGKTSIGRALSARIGWEFVDLDERIVTAAGMPITEIFAAQGESFFRQMEHDALTEVGGEGNSVVATGGGIVIRDDNRRTMRRHGVIVNLLATPEEVRTRLVGDETRPLLKDRSLDRIVSMLAEREQYYADADLRVDTTGRSVDAIVDEILVSLKIRAGAEVVASWK